MNRKNVSNGEFWANKIMDLANLSVVVLVFGQLTTEKLSIPAFIFGIVLYLLLVIISNSLRKR